MRRRWRRTPHRPLPVAAAQIPSGPRVDAGHDVEERLVLDRAIESQRRGGPTPPPASRFTVVEVVAAQTGTLQVVAAGVAALQDGHPHRHRSPPPQVCNRLSLTVRRAGGPPLAWADPMSLDGAWLARCVRGRRSGAGSGFPTVTPASVRGTSTVSSVLRASQRSSRHTLQGRLPLPATPDDHQSDKPLAYRCKPGTLGRRSAKVVRSQTDPAKRCRRGADSRLPGVSPSLSSPVSRGMTIC